MSLISSLVCLPATRHTPKNSCNFVNQNLETQHSQISVILPMWLELQTIYWFGESLLSNS